ncbi:hypothetical protein DAETH_14090 [Deinococcus aetherius]|uniref:Helix-turn-helix domain-containing protein n=1 Tax=Deinococcus aetherius TaxID=200252 RepID=A0ABM8ACC0_9DEIO|nr:helix-turn-helix domain-containing protein [Deinococcus aetherius]BDP41440.1 hypothetical protein DAETH_14090 [Deinococcus aetherius]
MTDKGQDMFTVPQVARLLHISDDTVRRQIREGDLEAIRIGTTPKGRPRYRILSTVVEQKLKQSTLSQSSALDRLREAFAPLTDEQKEELIERAIQWARAQTPDEPDDTPRLPEQTREEIARRLNPRAKKLLGQLRDE